MSLLLLLIIAHIAGDFILQPDSWVKDKKKNGVNSRKLIWHIIVHLILVSIVFFVTQTPLVPSLGWGVTIIVLHLIVDVIKSTSGKDNLMWFVGDQVVHVAVIVVAWINLTESGSAMFCDIVYSVFQASSLLIIIGYMFVIFPLSYVVKYLLSAADTSAGTADASAAKTGQTIGRLERVLILTFVLVDQFAAIGFLLAAKSVLRFNGSTSTAQTKNEYILVGTLYSFSLTILLGIGIKQLMV